MDDLDRAADAIARGDVVVYPTETVYGLGADALDAAAVERVFVAKGRDRERPLSMALPTVEAALSYTDPGERAIAFMRSFLPGPVTVVAERGPRVPDALTAGRERVGVRVPDHDLALALLERVAPVTATSANVSGEPSARRATDLADAIREAAAVVVDDGQTPGGASTVVDVERAAVIREGTDADAVRAWLET